MLFQKYRAIIRLEYIGGVIMNEIITEKLYYDDPSAQIVVFPQQDILTLSGGLDDGEILLPEDSFD